MAEGSVTPAELVNSTATLNDDGTVTLAWVNGAPADDPDPVAWTPTHRITLTLPGQATVEAIPAPQDDELEG